MLKKHHRRIWGVIGGDDALARNETTKNISDPCPRYKAPVTNTITICNMGCDRDFVSKKRERESE